MRFYQNVCRSRVLKGNIGIALIFFLILLAAVIFSFPIGVSAAPAWPNAWTEIASETSGGPANPYAIAADQAGNVYVTSNGQILKLANGSSSWTSVTSKGLPASPDSIAVDKNGDLYIADSSKSVVMYLKNEDTEAGWLNIGGRYATKIWIPKYWSEEWGWVEGHWEDSTANSGGIYFPYGVAVDDNLNVYVANPGDPGSSDLYNSLVMLKDGEWSILGNSYNGNSLASLTV